jgi:Fe-S cluster assembly ATP-binding protein
MGASHILQLDQVSIEVDGRPILHDVSLTIRPGETHVLFGPNGSGKTSLLMSIMGLSRYRDGGAILPSLLRLVSVIMDYDHAAAWPCR